MSTMTIVMPEWARVTERRLEHIARVTELLDQWASALHLPAGEAQEWHDAGRYHDALRDAPEAELRRLAGDLPEYTLDMLHGPAAANRLGQDGETRIDLLDAIRYHT